MREKVLIADLTALYVCLSEKWGTLERRALADLVYFRDLGGNPILLCRPGTPLTEAAKNEDIQVIEYTGKRIRRSMDISYYIFLKKLYQEISFDIVHCYGLIYVWQLCLLLKRKPQIPLILTLNKYINKKFKSFYYRFLFTRVDSLNTLDEMTKDMIVNYLPILKKRVHVLGVGIDTEIIKKNRRKDEGKIFSWKVGCYIPRNVESVQFFIPLFNSIRSFYEVKSNDDSSFSEARVVFSLFSDLKWTSHPINRELRGLIMDMGLEDYVRLENSVRPQYELGHFHILLTLENSEPFNDYEIEALLSNVPILVPRSSTRQSLVGEKTRYGETYKFSDARELKVKLLKIIGRYSTYLKNVNDLFDSLAEVHSLEKYSEVLYSQYEQLRQQRLRLSQRKKS
jgi:glycosyltransferase involved in cell wall biosynthesis